MKKDAQSHTHARREGDRQRPKAGQGRDAGESRERMQSTGVVDQRREEEFVPVRTTRALNRNN